jgi:hypothetical protein
MLSVNYRCIIVHYRKQLWGVFHYVVLSVLREVTVGHISSGRLHVTEYVFPDGAASVHGVIYNVTRRKNKRHGTLAAAGTVCNATRRI